VKAEEIDVDPTANNMENTSGLQRLQHLQA
jgi:hypothetical protein